MSEQLFVKHGEDIEVGHEYKRDNGVSFFIANFIIKPKEQKVWTDCGDPYMNFSVSFEEFLEIANKIKELKEDNELAR